jgi:predicted SnoaL-like aldol condensation-catalyzing enzyme
MQKTTPEENKARVLEAFDALFNRRDYDAAARFWSDGYIQHSAHIAPGRDSLFDLVRSLPDTLRYEHGLIMAEGDYVMVHGRFSGNGCHAAYVAVDVIRIEDGLLAEHWDVLQDEATQAQSKSGLPMFGDRFPPDGRSAGSKMPTELQDRLPAVLREVRTRLLFAMRLQVREILTVGDTPSTRRRIGVVFGGDFQGSRLSGEVLDGGNDWQSVRSDGSTMLDVRLTLKTDDGEIICMTYKGLRHGPGNVIQRLEQGEPVEPESYYFRISPMFETASAKYGWLNGTIAVGIGHRFEGAPVYSVFEVL